MKPNSSRFADKIQQNPKFSQRRWVNALFMCLPQAAPSLIEQALLYQRSVHLHWIVLIMLVPNLYVPIC